MRNITDRDLDKAIFEAMCPDDEFGLEEQPETLQRTVARIRRGVRSLFTGYSAERRHASFRKLHTQAPVDRTHRDPSCRKHTNSPIIKHVAVCGGTIGPVTVKEVSIQEIIHNQSNIEVK